mmetsp:Transcript_26964/g.81630  ORF Transcript_26964/g.81630 Transcript_26964/m.81630 type:complete len:236 (-) Transcript_26964:948-1655(-)|eukprot:scaffold97398_cov30-Tisochrysis_lutea.AAC.1
MCRGVEVPCADCTHFPPALRRLLAASVAVVYVPPTPCSSFKRTSTSSTVRMKKCCCSDVGTSSAGSVEPTALSALLHSCPCTAVGMASHAGEHCRTRSSRAFGAGTGRPSDTSADIASMAGQVCDRVVRGMHAAGPRRRRRRPPPAASEYQAINRVSRGRAASSYWTPHLVVGPAALTPTMRPPVLASNAFSSVTVLAPVWAPVGALSILRPLPGAGSTPCNKSPEKVRKAPARG